MDYEGLAKFKKVMNILQLIYDGRKYQLDGMQDVSNFLYKRAKIEAKNISEKHKGALEDIINQIGK